MSRVPPIPVELWEQVPPAAQTAICALVQQDEQHLQALQKQVDDPRDLLGKNSTNSSLPPSTDAPGVKRSPPQAPSGRKRGGQPGHPRQQRPLLPPDQSISWRPSACRRCGRLLQGVDSHPLRHQVIELPKIKPEVTEYPLHRLVCTCRGISTRGQLPFGVPSGSQGPRPQASLALLSGAYRLSKRLAESLCKDLLGIPISEGQIRALEHETARAVEPVVAELRDHVKTMPANVDETGWRQQRKKGWLWVVVTASITVFRISLSRAALVAQELISLTAGRVVTTDRYKGYDWLPLGQRQLCWAHWRRDFQAMIDRRNKGSAIGEDLLLLSDRLFGWWHRVRDGTLWRATMRRRVLNGVGPDFQAVLRQGSACGCAKTEATCQDLWRLEESLWTFVRIEGIEPTNNAAERALRHAVHWRKTSYGTDSEAGSPFVANILSIVATCRQQGRNVLEYLTSCCDAYPIGARPPSLLPMARS